MTRSRSSRIAVLAVIVAALAVPARAPAAPARSDVIVVLRDQADLRVPPGASRAARNGAVLRALRGKAEDGQRGLRALLAQRRTEGRVDAVRPFWVFNGLELVADPGVVAEVAARPEVAAVRPNESVAAPAADGLSSTPEPGIERVGAPALWSQGYTGQGVVVASLDTGVDATHPDLAGSWRGGANSWFDPNGEHPSTPTDVSGHGTWTMGVLAGGSGVGVAPGARWIAAKIFNDRGSATTARIHAAFQWLLDPDRDPATADAPNVVVNSWTLVNPGCNREFQLDLRGLRASGVLPVFAAGNSGPLAGTSLSPANNAEAVAVGATDGADLVDPSSSRGPSACGQPVYPQLVAPGVDVRTTDLFGGYARVSGTSIAAPHIAGALALLASAAPGTSPERQEGALEGGALDLGAAGPDDEYGFGRLNAPAALEWLRTAPDLVVQASPGAPATLAGGTVGYSVGVAPVNGFAADVALSLEGLSPSQASASFAPATIAGGSGTSALSVATASGLAPGTYPLTIRATSGSLSRTAFVNLVVLPPPDFTVKASPASVSVPAGGAVTSTIAVGALNGFASDVTLAVSGLSPAQGSWTFTPAVVTGGSGTSSLRLTTAAGLAPGKYPLTVTGTSGGLAHSVTLTLTVTAPPDFTLAVSPSSVTVTGGGTANYAVSVGSVGGFRGAVSLSVTGLPTGATATFSPGAPTAPASSTLAIRTRITPRGTFPLTITGQSGGLAHSAPATLVVR